MPYIVAQRKWRGVKCLTYTNTCITWCDVSDWPHIVNSEPTWLAFVAKARKVYDECKYATWGEPRIGENRSLTQSALMHVWLTECAAHYLSKTKKQVTPTDLEGMKRAAKARFYTEKRQPWMIHEIYNPFTDERKKDYTSSAQWKTGEMFMFLEWLQLAAANDGFVLESIGEFNKLQKQAGQ